MTDKVQKIREEVVRMHNLLPVMDGDNISVNYADRICTTLEMYIDSLQEEPVSEELEEAAKYCIPDESYHMIIESKEEGSGENVYDYVQMIDMFKGGANWKEEQFEKNRLKHCNELTDEQAQIESDFVTQHIQKNNRTPTFIDAIEYGMRLQKEQMMANAIDGEVGYWNLRGLSVNVKLPSTVEEGDKVKVIVIKED